MTRLAVIGGGISGLIAAHAIKGAMPESDIVIIERNEELGGLLAGSSFPKEGLYFDQGTHIFRETGVETIDQFMTGSVPADRLIHFNRGEGDLSGAVFGGRLQRNSHFPDIRSRADHADLSASLSDRASASAPPQPIERAAPLLSVARERFGTPYTDRIIAPMLAHMYDRPASELSGFALLLPGLTRVISASREEWIERSRDENFRGIFGFPDQRDLPSDYLSARRSFYAREQGTREMICGMTAKLQDSGCEIVTGASIRAVDFARGHIIYDKSDAKGQSREVDGFAFTIGAAGTARILGIDLADFGFDRPMNHRLLHLVVDDLVDSDLCYFYGLDSKTDFYRVTNYRGFSGRPDDRRLTVEILGERGIPDHELPLRMTAQLKEAGFLTTTSYSFAHVTRLNAGFPAPSVRNMGALSKLAEAVNSRLPTNAFAGGTGMGNGLFFQNEIVHDVHRASLALTDRVSGLGAHTQ